MLKRSIVVFIFFIFMPAVVLAVIFAPLRSVGMVLQLVIALALVFFVARLLTWPFYYFSDMLPRWLNSIIFLLVGVAFIVIWVAMLYQRYYLWSEGGDAVSFIIDSMFQGHRVMINDLIQNFSGYDMGMSFFTIENEFIIDYYIYGVFIFASAATGFILSRAELKANEDFETETIDYTTTNYVGSEIKGDVKINYYEKRDNELTFRRSWTPGQIYMLLMWVFLLLMFYFPLFTVVLMMIVAIVRVFNSFKIKLVLSLILTGAFVLFVWSPKLAVKGYESGFQFKQIFYGDGKVINRINMNDALTAIKSLDKNKQIAASNYIITIREIASSMDILTPPSFVEKITVKGFSVTKFTINDDAIAQKGIYYFSNQVGKNRILYLNGGTKEIFREGTEKYKSILANLSNFNFNAVTNTKYYLQSKDAFDIEAKTRNGLLYVVYYYSKRDYRESKTQLSPNLIIKDGKVVAAEMEVEKRAYRFYISYGDARIDMKELDDAV